ncbi:beta-ketoacyl synthase chain length factor [Arcobacter sp. KX21116]|uniref:beta-ketoacyl synthase chain length factor n=1 Tax=Arcobacter iocasae TaxID=2906515 RepID=UPI0035D452B8
MKINLEIINSSYIFGEKEIADLRTKELVPKMIIRRRLTRASKLVLELISNINFKKGRIIFGTSYGELLSTSRILNAISNNEILSPTDFQNSVYNTPVSYASILSNNTSEILTISSGEETSLKVLKVGAIKALDGDEMLLVCAETLNINNIEEVNTCIKYLESAVALKVKVTNEKATINLKDIQNTKYPKSIEHILHIAKIFKKDKKNIIEINI